MILFSPVVPLIVEFYTIILLEKNTYETFLSFDLNRSACTFMASHDGLCQCTVIWPDAA